jgi:hypothetical protein
MLSALTAHTSFKILLKELALEFHIDDRITWVKVAGKVQSGLYVG